MPIGKEPQKNSSHVDPKAQAWMAIATDPATDPQDFLTENPEDVKEFLADGGETEIETEQRFQAE